MIDLDKMLETLRTWSDAYYNGQPLVDDGTFDQLVKQYENLSGKKYEKVGAKPKTNKVNHLFKMKSLMNLFVNENDTKALEDELSKWLDLAVSQTVIIERKYDGLALSLYYKEGDLVDAVTRGDGQTGESVLSNLDLSSMCIPSKISLMGDVQISGEVLMSFENFAKLNKETPEDKQYKTPRNAAAGCLRSSKGKSKYLVFVPYDLKRMRFEQEKQILSKYSEIREVLKESGFYTVQTVGSFKLTKEDLKSHLEAYHDGTIKPETSFKNVNMDRTGLWNFPSDGLVYRLDELSLYEALKGTSHHPNWAYAIKTPGVKVETELLDIIGQVGRTGVVTPVALLKPVIIGGVEVSRCTLNNFNFIKQLNLNKGCTVTVARAGEVIPEIQGSSNLGLIEDVSMEPFTSCPCCHTKLENRDNGYILVCPNKNCKDKILANLAFTVDRDHLNIQGLGISQITQLYERGLIKYWTDFFNLEHSVIKNIWPDKTGDNIIKAIDEAREIELHRVISSMGMPYIGRSRSKEIQSLWEQKEHHFGVLTLLTFDEIKSVTNVGSKFQDTYFGVRDKIDLGDYQDLYLSIVNMERKGLIKIKYPERRDGKDLPLLGKLYCITGSFEDYTRDQLKTILEHKGAKITDSVSNRLTGIFAGENAGSKLEKASRNNIPIIRDIDAFLMEYE